MARVTTTHLGAARRHRITLASSPTLWGSRAEHEGRVPQPGVPPGPRNSSTASGSAGYHSDLSIPGYHPATPTAAPPSGEAAQQPAGRYAGAGAEYRHAIAALPPPIAAMSPLSQTTALSPVAAALGALLGNPSSVLVGGAGDALKALLAKPTPTPPPPASDAFTKDQLHPSEKLVGEFEQTGGAPVLNNPGKATILASDSPATVAKKHELNALIDQAHHIERQRGAAPPPPGWSPGSASAPKSASPGDPLGNRTPGRASAAELMDAQRNGTLKIGPDGKLTTPRERQAIRGLKRAQGAVASGGLEGPLTDSQKRFATLVSKDLGGVLKPRTIAVQTLQEQSGPNAIARDAEHNYNQLDIGYFDSGPGQLTHDPTWSHLPAAAKATAEFFQGKKYSPGGEIPQILERAKGKSVAEQLQIIGNSGWASSAYASDLAATAKLVSQHPNPKAVAVLDEAKGLAREAGIDPSIVLGAKGHADLGPVEPQIMARFQAGLKAAKQLGSLGLPYLWGGGHSSFSSPGGYDCSGSVSYVLHAMGVINSPLTSGDMGQALKPGPGAITVYYNGTHTFMKIGKHYFGTSNDNQGGGPGFFSVQTGISEVTSGDSGGAFKVGHVAGLGKKVALQLGLKPGELTGSPGMSMSSDGTEATIEAGAGASVPGAPSYSKSPIAPELVQLQAPTPAGPTFTNPATEGGAGSTAEELQLLLEPSGRQ